MESLNNDQKDVRSDTAADADEGKGVKQDSASVEKISDFGELLENFRPDQISDDFFYEATYNLNDRAFLQAVYRTYLKRDLDESGISCWLPTLSSGKFSRKNCLTGVRQSGEFKQKWPSALENIKLFSTLGKIKSVSLDFIGKVVSILFKPIF
ncbi:DUF4214 domain-containing protein [Microcoleus sp. FACHB-45]|nr:DUF4214 domain-containing protein [Microcoleus sp. FACHB-84]MBD2009627.1 DUF4214 domain-containing protein [Microcoleus sp. FACHB-45]